MPDKKLMWRHDIDNTRLCHTVRRALGMTRVEYHCGKVEDDEALS
jgi:hypothetical protein